MTTDGCGALAAPGVSAGDWRACRGWT